jgi:phosphoribosylanthranilate isomerase
MSMRARVKICCIQSTSDVDLVTSVGDASLGIGNGLSSQNRPDQLTGLARYIRDRDAESVLVTSALSANDVLELVEVIEPSAVQLTHLENPEEIRIICDRAPHVSVLPVVYVADSSSIELARSLSEVADRLILDTAPAGSRRRGATARTHNWRVSRRIVEQISCPVVLAGGLTPGNVGRAIRQVQPWGVDVCSGVRREDWLDRTLVREFFAGCKPLQTQEVDD